MKKLAIWKLALLATTAVGGVVVLPAAASAAPTGCSTGISDPPYSQYGGSWAYCTGGTGTFRAWVECWTDTNKHARYYGTWEAPDTYYSSAKCNSTYRYRYTYGVEKR